MSKIFLFLALILLLIENGYGQPVIIEVNASLDNTPVSPYIYGRNNNFSDSPGSPTSISTINLYKEAGLRMVRENGGNNATKYNWRLKLGSHPDWYNNVYDHNWDYKAQSIVSKIPDMQVMFAFQLIGKVASNKNNNFGDWAYNSSQWWSGTGQNLAGGGVVNPAGGSDALKEGNPDLYLMDWDADSTTEILNHWFGANGLGLNKNNFMYWSMDNEPEIWGGTHDDVYPAQPAASVFMDKYFQVAKKAREKYPDIKLTGPVTANEWQWFRYADETLKIDGKTYCWLEYFIKRVADEQKASGIRLLDVLDIHWYPGESKDADVVQLYRAFYDKSYVYPGSNGVKTVNGGWDTSQNKEYIFQRINDWLTKHFGENHGITVGLTECDFSASNPNVMSVLYASILGTFANNGVEVYTPWSWKTGMWETLHLFSRYAKSYSVNTTTSLEERVSGYTTISTNADSMTIMLVNRDLKVEREVQVNISDFMVDDGSYTTFQLASLPSNETFKSHTSNALKSNTVTVNSNSFTITLPALSTTAVILKGNKTGIEELTQNTNEAATWQLFPNPAINEIRLKYEWEYPINSIVTIFDQSGRIVHSEEWLNTGDKSTTINTSDLAGGIYFVEVKNNEFKSQKKVVVLR